MQNMPDTACLNGVSTCEPVFRELREGKYSKGLS